jgi:hypothetical protein
MPWHYRVIETEKILPYRSREMSPTYQRPDITGRLITRRCIGRRSEDETREKDIVSRDSRNDVRIIWMNFIVSETQAQAEALLGAVQQRRIGR